MKVGFVIPVHNRRETTLRALGTLTRIDRRGLDLRVFVVDDGSCDGTSDAVRAAFPDVQILQGDGTLHYAAGTNMGLRAALDWGARHVVAANDDSIFHADSLQRLVATAEATPRAVVGALLLRWDQPHRVFQVAPQWDLWYGGWRLPESLTAFSVPDRPFDVELVVGNCVLIPAEAMRAHGLLDAANFRHGWGDAQFTMRLRRAGWRLVVDPRARVWCEPNTNPPPLATLTAGELARVLLVNERHPMNLKRQFVARWHSAPSKPQAVAAFGVFFTRLMLKGLGIGEPWPAWPDPAPRWQVPVGA